MNCCNLKHIFNQNHVLLSQLTYRCVITIVKSLALPKFFRRLFFEVKHHSTSTKKQMDFCEK